MQFHVSGKVEASTEPYDMRLQRMLGHMPALFHRNPKSVLVVGFGAGVTAGTFVTHPEVQRIVICEMEPLIPPTATRYFGKENYNVMHDPRVQIVYDDARHYILTTNEKFDIITSDPIHPWVKGSATLYSKEYFELVKRHLNPGGIVTQWVPLYESDTPTVKSEIATFFDVFPNGTVWGNENNGGYDSVVMGQAEPMKIDLDAMQAQIARPDHRAVGQSLYEVGFQSLPVAAGDLCRADVGPAAMAGRRRHQSRRQPAAAIHGGPGAQHQHGSDDLQPDPELPASSPSNLFQGSEDKLQALRYAMEASGTQ